uniref:Ankyrin repeat domain-containing protein 12 n=1 Tax=Glossina brevipalpis TaxID=37001 RepID=A0A1A9WQ13_9MUSC
MPPPRPRGIGCSTGIVPARPNPNTPMSERQQMALLIQMTASSSDHSRSYQKTKKSDEMEDNHALEKLDVKDKTDELNNDKKDNSFEVGNLTETSSTTNKRNFSDIDEEDCDDNDETKKKRRKDSDTMKDKQAPNSRIVNRTEKNVKSSTSKGTSSSNKSGATADKDDVKNKSSTYDAEADEEDLKNEVLYSGGLKVPPLKIVIPQQNCTIDTDGTVSRTGKISVSRNAALPYVVSSNNDCSDGLPSNASPRDSPNKISTSCNVMEEKHGKLFNEDKNLRVLRSAHRSGLASHDRNSNNPSPQMQSNSPSPASSTATDPVDNKISYANVSNSPPHQNACSENENIVNLPSPSTSSTSSSKEVTGNNVELHPRKRKIRSKNEDVKSNSNNNSNNETSLICSESHPHDLPFTNCFQMYMNIRRQIEKKWKNVFPVKPRPPQGYDEYLINTKNYTLHSKQKVPDPVIPSSTPSKMKEIFLIQEKERLELYQRHTVEREKLCLNVEQEIIRVHSKAARNISCQSLPFSVCTFIKDEEVYNIVTPEQDEKDKNARYRFNGRLLLSWLQDVDDKWEKIKESMILRHHNEAESLHAVQLMDWEIALKKNDLCGYDSQIAVESTHVPIVQVEDFDLLPA